MNHYEAPKAHVEDVILEDAPHVRPPQVALAIKLAAASMVLGGLDQLVGWDFYRGESGTVSLLLLHALGLLAAVWIYYKIYLGRNWARIVLLIVTLLALLTYADSTQRALFQSVPPLAKILNIASWGIDVGVLWLLYTKPGSAWFRRKRGALAA
jgi:presenilin-like A22 family membrane protease